MVVRLLRSGTVRLCLCAALCFMGRGAAVSGTEEPAGEIPPEIKELLDDSSRALSPEAKRTLGLVWSERYRYGHLAKGLAGALRKAERAKVVGALLRVVGDTSRDTSARITCAFALGEMQLQPDAVIPVLRRVFRERDRSETWSIHYLRCETLRALGKFGPRASSALPDLIFLIERSWDEGEVAAAIDSLVEIGPSRSADPKRALLTAMRSFKINVDNAAWDTGRAAAWALLKLGQPDEATVAALSRMVQTGHSGLRLASARVLGSYGAEAKSALPALRGLLRDKDPRVRLAAAVASDDILPSEGLKRPHGREGKRFKDGRRVADERHVGRDELVVRGLRRACCGDARVDQP